MRAPAQHLTWIYEQEGPRPLSNPPAAVEGDRVDEVVAVMGFEVPLRYEVKRLADETITVPAGKFDGCRRLQMVVVGIDSSGQPNRTRYDHWFDAKGHGLIKEIVVSNDQADNSHRSVSSLKEHVVP